MEPVFQILLVESDPKAVEQVRSALPATFEILQVKDEAALKARLQHPTFDLALVEPWLAGGDGLIFQSWTVAKEYPTPVVILTACDRPDAASIVEKIGAAEFYVKSEAVYQNLAKTCSRLVRYQRIMTQDPLAMPNGMILFDRDLAVQAFNSTARVYVEEIAGRVLEVGSSASSLLIEADYHFLQGIIANASKESKEQWTFPLPISYGGLRWLEISINLLFNRENEVSGICLYIQDLTRLRETQEVLRTHEATLRTLINASPGATILIDPQGTILAANEIVAAWYNKSFPEFIGSSIFEYLRSPMREAQRQIVEDVLKTQKMVTLTDFAMGRYLRLQVFPVFDDAGDVRQLALFIMDVTEQKQAEILFQRRDAIMQAVNLASEYFLQPGSWRDRIQEVLQCWGEAAAVNRTFIYQRKQTEAGEAIYTLLYGWDSSGEVSTGMIRDYSFLSLKSLGFGDDEEVLRQGGITQRKLSATDPELFEIYQANNVKALLMVPVILNGELWGFIGFADCVIAREWSTLELDAVKTTAHILAAALRREQEEMSRAALLNALPDLMFLFDRNGALVDYHTQNPGLLARPPEEFLGKTLDAILPGPVAEIHKEAFKKALATGEPQVYEYFLPLGKSQNWEGRMVRSGEGAVVIVRDITEQRRFEEELRESGETIREVYEITSSNVLSFDEKLQALLVMGCQRFNLENGAIFKVVANSFEVIQNYSPTGLFTSSTIFPAMANLCREIIRTNQTLTIEDINKTKFGKSLVDSKIKLHSFIGAPLRVGSSLFGTLGFSSQQIHTQPFSQTEQRFLSLISQWIGMEMERELYLVQIRQNAEEISNTNRELAVARDEALEVSRLKTEFLATMSHEIRTPMNAVMGMTELLLESPLDVEQREYAETARDSARLLLSLLNNVLDFSKIEAGKLVLEQINFDPQKVLDDAVGMFSLQAQKKRIQLDSFVSPQIPDRLKGDPTRFSQVVINLVANAIKFTDQGHVTVWSELVNETPQTVEIMVQVRDTGIGLSEAAKTKIFSPFTQADGSTTRRFGGSGLGLAIAKRLVDRMGGSIGVESVEGAGSRFWFTAQLQRGDGQPARSGQTALPVSANQRLLVFERLEEARNLWRRYLEDWHIPYDLSETPEALLERLEAIQKDGKTYSGCIVDMEGMQRAGEKLSAKLVHLINANHLRVIMVCGFEKRLRSQNTLPFDSTQGRLARPFSRSALQKILASLIHEDAGQKKELSTAPVKSQPVKSSEALTVKLILVAEDNPANQHLTAVQLKRLGYRVVTVSAGAEAVEELARRYKDYALVLMDVQMPGMDGYQATRLIRKGEEVAGGHIPIVAITANVLHDDRQACLAAGMDAYIPKPVLLDDLRKVLHRCLKGGEVDKAANPAAAPTVTAGPDMLLDQRILDDLRSLNQPDQPDFLKQLIALYLEDSKSLVEKIREAIKSDDMERVRKAIHSMKGISSNLGAARFSQLCWQVEHSIRSNTPLAEGWLASFEAEYALTCDALKQVALLPDD